MRLSTSTNLVNNRITYINEKEVVKKLYDTGFKIQDIGLTFYKDENFLLAGDNWQQKVSELADFAAALGVEFSQSHLPFISSKDMAKMLGDEEEMALYKEMVRRSYIANSILGVKWTVAHTYTRKIDNYDAQNAKTYNYEFYAPFVELGKKLNVGTAFENMLRRQFSSYRRRYCEHYVELVDFVEKFEDEKAGICWDFGHGNVMGLNQEIALKYVGKYLRATHVNDNKAADDDHMVPFMGTVDWLTVMRILKEIEYKGDFTFEIFNMTKNMPLEIQQPILKACYDIGNYLLSL